MHDAGTVLAGRYRVVRTIGAGGMGTVLEAVQLDLDRRVAIKVLDPELAKDPVLVARMRREARAAAALSHPNVAQVYALHEGEDGTILVAMELVRGETLRAVQRESPEGRVPLDRLLALARGLLAGLAAAHAAGVVHRDVKPENAIVTKDGRKETVKLVDFGIARSALPSESAPLTARGTVVGTPAYMAPEQVRGEEAGARADVWAAGVVLFELAAGRRPFRGADTLATMRAILETEPPLLSDEIGAPEALSAAVARALRKDPAARFAHAGEMLAALDAREAASKTVAPMRAMERGAGADPSGVTQPFPLVRRSAPWWGIALGLGAVGGALVFVFQAPPAASVAPDAGASAASDAAAADADDDAGRASDASPDDASAARDPLQAALAECVHDARTCFQLERDDGGRVVNVIGSGDPALDRCAFERIARDAADASTPDEICVE